MQSLPAQLADAIVCGRALTALVLSWGTPISEAWLLFNGTEWLRQHTCLEAVSLGLSLLTWGFHALAGSSALSSLGRRTAVVERACW